MTNLYVSLRCGKINQSTETAMHNHNMRVSETKKENNVDYSRSHLNKLIMGRSDTVKAVNERIEEIVPRKVRADANRILEFVISASPEYFYDFEKLNITRKQWDSLTPVNDKNYHNKVKKVFETLDQKKLDQFTEKVKEFCKQEFGENLINCVLHLDEKTPHFHIAITPIVKNSLTAKKYFTPITAKGWQDKIGDLCAPLGLLRGEENDKKHESLKDNRLKQAVKNGYRKGYKAGYKKALANSDRFANKVENFMRPGQLEANQVEIENLKKNEIKLKETLKEAQQDRYRVIDKNRNLQRELRKYEPIEKLKPSVLEPQKATKEALSTIKPQTTAPIIVTPSSDSVAGAEASLNEALSNLKNAELKHGINSPQAINARVAVQRAKEALNRANEARSKPKI
ncbi:MobV family relaxase [Pusillimonas sp. ANT_WB101]|uniref:MobV family relaxase n=1 Tax=Pusillimonas sp. ANT_WB101 TaxID=2597356 RepID=UPI0011EF5008|nr:MobV family relaxase [Pusillimonas sp. ANT_WB101]KAA0890253.1 hypothetical protein FQ179_18230 [Pusillimonas sp. ANT_WB101]